MNEVKMNATWDFLTPWYTVLCRHLFKWQGSAYPSLSASVLTPSLRDRPQMGTLFVIRLPFDPETSRDRVQLQRLRESIDLFSLLAMTNNAAFIKFMESYIDSQSRDRLSYSWSRYCRPEWGFWFEGALSHRGTITSIQSPFTWGSLLGFPDDPWEYSQEFHAAVQKLEAVGIDAKSRERLGALSTVRWKCDLPSLQTSGDHRICERPNSTLVAAVSAPQQPRLNRGYGARSFFDTDVPPHFQFCVDLDAWRHTDAESNEEMFRYTQTDALEAVAHIPATEMNVLRDVTEVTGTLSQVALSSLILEAIGKAHRIDSHVVVEAPEYLCLDYDSREGTEYLPRLFVVGSLENIEVHSSLCTAVAEAPSTGQLDIVFKGNFEQMTGPIRWAWLIYAVFCGSSSVSRNSVQIWGSLSSEDLVMIEEVLRTNYPQPVLQQSQDHPSKYGFVDIQEGAQLSGKNGIRLEITRALRCRALYNPTTMGDSVEVVVPGYGICTAKIEDGGNNFVSDAVCPSLPSSQLKSICSLMLHLSTLESVATLMQLLRLIGGSLRSLYLGSQRDQAADLSSQSHMQQAYLSLESQRQHIDLCMLATICPDQEKLDLKFYGIRVSVPNEALRQWAIKEMTLYGVGDFSALMTCLTDTTLRMRKTLAVLGVFSYIRPLCPDDIERLIALEGEFLPVTKEKFPKLSKAAMLSAVRSGWNNNSSTGAMRALSRLDASVLSLIFTFASIPERRYIRLK